MRDVVIASLLLGAAAYVGFAYEPTPEPTILALAETGTPALESQTAVAAPAAGPGQVMSLLPIANPWRQVPAPMARPSTERAVASLEPTRKIVRQDVSVLHAGLVEVDGERHALFGVDAPSVNQTCRHATAGLWACGTDARKAVAGFVSDKAITCDVITGAVEGAPAISHCRADDVDLNEWVVTQGWAVADASVHKDYLPAQGDARRQKRGLWAGWFETPSEWRARNTGDVKLALSQNRI